MNANPSLVSDWWDVSPKYRPAFLDWCNGPYRMSLAQSANVQRLYTIDDGPDSFLSWNECIFDDQNSHLPALPADLPVAAGEIAHQRFYCELMRDVGSVSDTPAPWLYIVHTDIPDYIVDEYNAWYDEEHLPRLVTVPGVLRARRFRAHGVSPAYLTAYDLSDRDAFESPAGLKARKTPWTEKMRSLFCNTRRSMARLAAELDQGI